MTEFDLLIVGAGSGNTLIGPEFDDSTVALVDDGEHFGGTCLNAGCIPTKMFVRPADVITDARDGSRLDVDARAGITSWREMRDRVFARTDSISEAGERYRATGSPNVTLYRQSVRLDDPHTVVTASGERLHADRVVVAAGSRPRPLGAPHPDDAAIHDSDTIMRIDELPASLTILGGGAVAVEFAHIFSAFGVDVTVVTRSARILTDADEGLSQRATELFGRRVTHVPSHTVDEVRREGALLSCVLDSGDEIRSEALLVAQGRVPNTDRLRAAAAGFDLEPDGRLVVDAQQRAHSGGTPLDGVYALGDVSSAHQLKHVANHQARVVAHNLAHPDALIGGDPGPVPAAIFGNPQIAMFGVTEAQAVADGREVIAVTQEYGSTAFGWALEDETSFCTLVVDADDETLLGAHLIGPEAASLIQPLLMAASLGLKVPGLARAQYWPHPAPTEIVENALLSAEERLAEHSRGA